MFEKDGYVYGGTPQAPVLDVIHAVAVRPMEGYQLWLKFTDGAEKIFDFKPHLTGSVFQPLKDKKIFDSVYLQYGTTVWQDGEIDIAPETLYYEGVPVNA
jgi:hypothetical protein